jgi:hypothetical protein
MSAKVATVTASPEATTKVVPLHHQMGHEEQVKNTDQGNIAVDKSRSRKHPLPASDLAKVPTSDQNALEQQIAYVQQRLNALSPEEKAAVTAQLNASLATLQAELPVLAKAMSGSSDASAPAKDGDNSYNAWNQSILMLYTAFAKSQMDQNGQIMNGWQAQQQAQNATLQEAADAEAQNAKDAKNAANTNQASPLACAGWGALAALIIGIAVAVVLTVLTGGAAAIFATAAGAAIFATATGAGIAVGVAAGVAAGVAVGVSCYFGDKANQTSSDKDPNVLEMKAPDQGQLQQLGLANQFWSTISQKTNNQISSGSQTNLVNASSNDTQLGQQASQVIQAMGQVMQTPVAH